MAEVTCGERRETASSAVLRSEGDVGVNCAIVIVTYNSSKYIDKLLNSLKRGAGELSFKVIVVDNCSQDSTVQLVKARPEVTCIVCETNRGYAAGINVARAHAGRYDSLVVLNPDLVVDRDAFPRMFEALNDPAVGIVAPMIVDNEGELFLSLRREPSLLRAIGDAVAGKRVGRRPGWLSEVVRGKASYEKRRAIEWASGAALMVSQACDRTVGCWDEEFFLYSEETDYANRARQAGFRVEYLPTARVRHRGGGSGQSDELVALRAISRIRYMEKHGRSPKVFRLAVILCELLRWGQRRHRLALRACLRRSKWDAIVWKLQSQ